MAFSRASVSASPGGPPPARIWVMNADGSGQISLTALGSRDYSPAWSPDGERIAFARQRDAATPPLTDIWVMSADGSGQTNITDNPDDPRYSDGAPDWSPDGQSIAFHSNRDWTTLDLPAAHMASEIWLMGVDGSDATPLTKGGDPPLRRDPAWSPDGERVAFTLGGLFVIGADGGGETRLTRNGSEPAWSPDGRTIAFWRTVEEEEYLSVPYIYVMNADGSGVTPLTRDARAPAWSPDGRRIAFSRVHPGSAEDPPRSNIWTMDADGGCQAQLTTSPTNDHDPAWQPRSNPPESAPCFTLSVFVTGSGTGRVTGPAITCPRRTFPLGSPGTRWDGEMCTASFAEGTDLILAARAERGSRLSEWGGDCAGTDRCKLTMTGDRQVSASFAALRPNLRVGARPRQRRVGPNRRRVRYALVVENVGDWRSGTVNLCARGPQRRLRILGNRCVTREIPAGADRQRRVSARIKPAARGKVTRIRLIARGPNVQNRRTVARLRVRR